MDLSRNNIHQFRRGLRARTAGARIAKILNDVRRPPPSGTGVLAVSRGGELYQGRRFPEAFLWEPANEEVWAVFRLYCASGSRKRRAA